MIGENEKQVFGRCEGCENMGVIYGSGGWSFPACYHKPYNGKWTREIEICPIGKKNRREPR